MNPRQGPSSAAGTNDNLSSNKINNHLRQTQPTDDQKSGTIPTSGHETPPLSSDNVATAEQNGETRKDSEYAESHE